MNIMLELGVKQSGSVIEASLNIYISNSLVIYVQIIDRYCVTLTVQSKNACYL